jgi:hypothetical protein
MRVGPRHLVVPRNQLRQMAGGAVALVNGGAEFRSLVVNDDVEVDDVVAPAKDLEAKRPGRGRQPIAPQASMR